MAARNLLSRQLQRSGCASTSIPARAECAAICWPQSASVYTSSNRTQPCGGARTCSSAARSNSRNLPVSFQLLLAQARKTGPGKHCGLGNPCDLSHSASSFPPHLTTPRKYLWVGGSGQRTEPFAHHIISNYPLLPY